MEGDEHADVEKYYGERVADIKNTKLHRKTKKSKSHNKINSIEHIYPCANKRKGSIMSLEEHRTFLLG